MTTRSKAHFNIADENGWTDHKGHRYCYGILNALGFQARQEGTVGVTYVLKLGANPLKVDAPNPPFLQEEGGSYDEV